MKTLLTGFLISFSILTNAQDAQKDSVVVLTLDDCIQTALNRNIQIKRTKNNLLAAESNKFQAIMNFFPSLSAGANYALFFGTFFDTNAARQVTEVTKSSSPFVSANMVLFNGFANHHNVKQRKYELLASIENVESSKQDVESAILLNYLNVILDIENIKIEKERVELLEQQLEREKKRVSVGVGSPESVYNFQSQLATQKLTLNNREVQYKRDHLRLLQSMQLDVTDRIYEVADYEINEENLLSEVGEFDEIFQDIIEANPTIAAARYTLTASKYLLKQARANRLPTLTVGGQIGSNFSSNGATNPSKPYEDPETGQPGYNFEPDATLFEQLNYNGFEALNFTFNIPIFTRYNTATQIQRSKVDLANAELGVYESVNTITNTIQSAYLDLVSAQNTYRSAKENLEMARQSFEFMKKRFETGNTDFYTYFESLNSKNRSEIELVNAKYSIIFRQKVLELYRGS